MVCPICNNNDAKTYDSRVSLVSKIDCPQCGVFSISSSAIAMLNIPTNFPTERWKISAWINEFKPEIISSAELDTARASAVPSLQHRADRMLRWINSKFRPGTKFYFNNLGQTKQQAPIAGFQAVGPGSLVSSPLMPIGWNQSIDEMKFMLASVLCEEMGYLVDAKSGNYQVSPKGLLYLEGRRESVSSIGFCAMWFSDEVLPLWLKVIEPAIRLAGYDPLKIDLKPHNEKIDDEIMASIRASRFVVADFTNNRGGVYYEAGFAHGLGLPVIFMCREGDSLHFDIRQYNCIFWTSDKLEEAQSQLKNRILATLGQGPILVQ
jgi:hypothetical protein